MQESLTQIDKSYKDEINQAVDKLGEDIAIDINQLEANFKEISEKVEENVLQKGSKEKRDKSVGNPVAEDLVKNLIRQQLKDIKYHQKK
jgi:hypothetical protein